MKKIISTIMEGIGISFIVANITFLIFLTEYSGVQIIYSYILWMTAGIFYGLAGLIHDTSLNKILVIGLHLLSNLLISFTAIEIMFRAILNEVITFSYHYLLIIFIIIYLCITIIRFLFSKLDTKKLNKKLQNNN